MFQVQNKTPKRWRSMKIAIIQPQVFEDYGEKILLCKNL